ncbi:MAG: hypothetical protein LBJ88_02670, partial [Campylobacteraceae bacterium]|nr:hypothetical protein [Campylobacteraceae bacterium]
MTNQEAINNAQKALGIYTMLKDDSIQKISSKKVIFGKFGVAGSVINFAIDVAQGEPIDEVFIKNAVDLAALSVITAFAPGGLLISIGLAMFDITPGEAMRRLYTYVRPSNMSIGPWDYVKDYQVLGGELVPYARIPLGWTYDDGEHAYIKITEEEYNEYQRTKQAAQQEYDAIKQAELDTFITEENGYRRVTFTNSNISVIYTAEGNIAVAGGDGEDIIMVHHENVIANGGGGDDTIHTIGRGGVKLNGGLGFDTYYASDGDIINDEDGNGKVVFKSINLTGGDEVKGEENKYRGSHGETYIYDEDSKLLTVSLGGAKLTIENFENGDLGIELGNTAYVAIKYEGSDNDSAKFTISLSKELESDVEVSYKTSNLDAKLGEHFKDNNDGKIVIKAGSKEVTLEFDITAEEEESEGCEAMKEGLDFKVILSEAKIINENPQEGADNDVKVEISESKKEAIGEIFGAGECDCGDECMCGDECSGFDPDKIVMTDPLAFDMDKDGKLSTIALSSSEVYFDLDGDGFKDRVSWLNSNDAFLVYDKNGDGKIDGINELFGNNTKNGFDELKEVADSNYDNKIDKKDVLFNRLQLWQDLNQNGKVDEGELKSLGEAGIKSINLNSTKTMIEIDGALITDASRYTDGNANEHLAADLVLEYIPRNKLYQAFDLERIDFVTYSMPNIKGSSFTHDTFVAYNIDENFKNLALEYTYDIDKVINNFDEFVAEWSGFYKMAEEHNIQKEDFSEGILKKVTGIKLWILEHFSDKLVNSSAVEVHINENTKGRYHKTSYTNEQYILDSYDSLVKRYQAVFAMQTYYMQYFEDCYAYNVQSGKFNVYDNEKFNDSFISFMNTVTEDSKYKYFLAVVLNNLKGVYIKFDLESSLAQIEDNDTRAIIATIFNSEKYGDVYFVDNQNLTLNTDAIVFGNNDNNNMEIISNYGSTSIYAGSGNDKIISKNSNDAYFYNLNDGYKIISDTNGTDKIVFGDGIERHDISFRLNNNDLIISIKDSDSIIIIGFRFKQNQIEEFLFASGDKITSNSEEILSLYVTDGAEVIETGDDNDILYAKGGDDIVRSNGGSDIVYGGDGNDTIYGGEGDDIIYGNSGKDIIFGENGDDVIYGGTGADLLYGGDGDDIYIFNIGDGADTIRDENGVDTIIFGENISKEDLIAKSDGSDLIIAIREYEKSFDELKDKIIIKNYFTINHIEIVKLNNGTVIRLDELQQGTDDNDILIYGSESDVINAGSGNDVINAGNGDDILIGGKGNDILDGGYGNDTYMFNKGDGRDTITDSYGTDTISFGENITKDDLIVRLSGNDLIIAIKEEEVEFNNLSDKVTIKNYIDSSYKIENILFFDGSRFDITTILYPTQDDDYLIYLDNAVTIDALGGDDVVISGNGNDTLYGNSGNDKLYGNGGNDVLDGGAGNDLLEGGLGNDTYMFGRGYGKDTVYDNGGYGYTQFNAGIDTLEFKGDINKDDLWVKIVGKDLVIGIKEEGKSFNELKDVVTIKDYFNANNRIEAIKLGSGTIIKLDELQQGTEGNDNLIFDDDNTIVHTLGGDDTVTTGAGDDEIHVGDGNDTVNSNAGDDLVYAGSGNDKVYAGSGNDIIYGEDGDDIINGEDGDDTLVGGAGNDTLNGGNGDDTYIFNLADGEDIINDTYGNDTLLFGEGIVKDDIIAKASNNDLVLYIKEDGKDISQLSNSITIKNFFKSGYIENLKLHDGTILKLDEIEFGTDANDYLVYDNTASIVDAKGGNDTIITGSKADVIYGGNGNDTINSNGGNDTVYGEAGNDIINSGTGDDVLFGGQGDDTIYGGLGDDTYVYNRGDGHDTINDEGENDKIVFGEGISKDDLIFKQTGYDLTLALKDGDKKFADLGDSIKIINYFKYQNSIETIVFDDGTAITNNDIAKLFANVSIKDTIFSEQGAVLRGGLGDDTYVYNRGDFTVVIDDFYSKNEIDVSAGNDTLVFGTEITKEDVTIGVNGDNLIIIINDNTGYEQLRDTVVIKDWKNENRGIEKIIFSDGEILLIDKNNAFPDIDFNNNAWINNRYYIYGNDNDDIQGTSSDDIIKAEGGEDIVYTQNGNDIVYGGDGDDIVDTGAGNDRLIGGKGDDYLKGDSGNDTYIYSKGGGRDFIVDSAGNDVLYFDEGISRDDIAFKVYDNNLVIGIKEGSKSFFKLEDRIIIKDWYGAGRVEKIEFSDGTSLSASDIISAIGTDAGESIRGIDNAPNIISAHGGDDVIKGYNYDDILNGDSGNDTIYGGSGNDIIDGGIGEDTLFGEQGNDTYIFSKGMGHDTVVDNSGLDTIKMTGGLTSSDVVYWRKNNDLLIGIREYGKLAEELNDVIKVKDWYLAQQNRVEIVLFDNGEILSSNEFLTATESNDTFTLGDENNDFHALSGNDTIYAQNGDDTIYGGDGNDILYGENG